MFYFGIDSVRLKWPSQCRPLRVSQEAWPPSVLPKMGLIEKLRGAAGDRGSDFEVITTRLMLVSQTHAYTHVHMDTHEHMLIHAKHTYSQHMCTCTHSQIHTTHASQMVEPQ